MAFDLGDYKDVPTRIAEFREKHPDGSLRPLNSDKPFELVSIGDRTFIVVVAAAYRTPDDAAPGVGMAWEQFPGTTNYTRNSELQNAETSAWGRAIVAALASESKAVASQEDVRNRQAEHEPAAPIARGDVDGLHPREVKEQLEARGLPVGGTVPEMKQRLAEALGEAA